MRAMHTMIMMVGTFFADRLIRAWSQMTNWHSSPLENFTEDFADALNTSFFITVEPSTNVTLSSGSLRINGSLVVVDDAREGFLYTNQTVSNNDFIVTTFINVTDNSVSTNALHESGILLHNQSDTNVFFFWHCLWYF